MAAQINKFVTLIDRWCGLRLLILVSVCMSGCSPASMITTPTLTPAPCAISYEQVAAQGTFSPDQRFAAIASEFGTALYDAQTHTLRGCLGEGRGLRPDLMFSSDSQFLIVAGSAGFSIDLWQLVPDLRLIFHTNSVLETNGVALSPNHQLLAILGWDGQGSSHYLGGTLKIWDVNRGRLVREFQSIYSLKGFTSDSRELDVTICTNPDTVCGASDRRRLSIYSL